MLDPINMEGNPDYRSRLDSISGRSTARKQPAKTAKKSRWKNYLLLGLAGLTIGYTAGRYHESRDHFLYQTTIKFEIMKAHDEGYKFAVDADPVFFKNKAMLYKDSKTKTMFGVMVNPEGKIIGPVRRGGVVGLKWYEQIKHDYNNFFSDAKAKAESLYVDLKNKMRGTYHDIFSSSKSDSSKTDSSAVPSISKSIDELLDNNNNDINNDINN